MNRTEPFRCAFIFAGLLLGAPVDGQACEARFLPPSTATTQVTEVQATSGSPDTLTSRGPARKSPQHGAQMSATGGGDHVLIQLNFYRAQSWDYARVTGELNPIAPNSMRYAKALPDSEIVLKRAHAASSAKILLMNEQGSADLAAIERGSLNIALRPLATTGSREGTRARRRHHLPRFARLRWHRPRPAPQDHHCVTRKKHISPDIA